jgi:hypothetical protein
MSVGQNDSCMWDPSPASSPSSETNGQSFGSGILSSRSGVLALLLLLPQVTHEITMHKEIWWWVEAGDGDGDAWREPGRGQESNAMAAPEDC